MADYILSCCSPADLSKEHFERIDVRYVCFHYFLNGVEYPDDLGQTIPFEEFYARMSAGEDTRTAQVNVSEYVDFFTPFLEKGKDVVHVCLSSGISLSIVSMSSLKPMSSISSASSRIRYLISERSRLPRSI